MNTSIKVTKIDENQNITIMSFVREGDFFQLYMGETTVLDRVFDRNEPKIEKQEDCKISLDTLISMIDTDELITSVTVYWNGQKISFDELKFINSMVMA